MHQMSLSSGNNSQYGGVNYGANSPGIKSNSAKKTMEKDKLDKLNEIIQRRNELSG